MYTPHMQSFFPKTPERIHADSVRLQHWFSGVLQSSDVVMLCADNSFDWLAADLALQNMGAVVIPIPGFFTQDQIDRISRLYQPSFAVGDRAYVERSMAVRDVLQVPDSGLVLAQLADGLSAASRSITEAPGSKLTFTSGSTGDPKGIVIRAEQQWHVARSIANRLGELRGGVHLSLLPYPVLLENVAGAYSSILLDSSLVIPALYDVGLVGSSQFDPDRAVDALVKSMCTTTIVLPHMLSLILDVLERRAVKLPALRYVAVGGARVASGVLERARALRFPVYEGYGLTEASSVVCMNTPEFHRSGSVGRPLSHQVLDIAEDGEILLSWSVVAGAATADGYPTGDLGEIDADGYLYIRGRKKNVLITGFGRNVSPEWPESLLLEQPVIRQAMVYGDGDPTLSALLVPSNDGVSDVALDAAMCNINAKLPDYAQIGTWKRVPPFTQSSGLLTGNGRLRRERIAEIYVHLRANTSH